jgi:ubiquinone/menaquinone biosynthesis C-methylase UbiE
MIKEYPDMIAHFNLLDRSVGSYDDLLKGRKTPDEILFPVFSLEYIEGIFKGYRLADYFNVLIARIVSDYVRSAQRPVNILEIGSGSGSTSEFVFDMIKDLPGCRFIFTDISKVFTRKADRKYSASYPFVQFQQLDVEKNLKDQGIEDDSIDLMIAANVIHATRNINDTLTNLQPALKTGGILLLNEVTESQDFVTLTFGMMDGWWRFEDIQLRLPDTPLLSLESWKKILSAMNFNPVETVTTSSSGKKDSFGQSVILAEKP